MAKTQAHKIAQLYHNDIHTHTHTHTHTHSQACANDFNKVFLTFSWMTTQNYSMYSWHAFIRWPTADMERASLPTDKDLWLSKPHQFFFVFVFVFFNYTISINIRVISHLKKKVLQMSLYFSMKYPIFQWTLNLFFIITTIISWIIQPSITTNTLLLGSSHLFS